jgi:cytochrome c
MGLVLGAAAPSAAQDVAAGAADFSQRCHICHTGELNSAAPNLAGVVGRKAASAGFNYSAALTASGLTWSRPALDAFLADPMKMTPGTRMLISTPDPKRRADLVAYLATLR